MPPLPGVRPDLATRLHQSQRALKGRLGKPDTHLALIRAAHGTLDPEKIGELLIDRAMDWFQARSCAVVATVDGQLVPLAGRGLGGGLSSAAGAVARWVLRSGRQFATADLRHDPRVTGTSGAVVAMPLRCRGRTIGAVVVLDRAASAVEPKLGNGVAELLWSALEGPAIALDNALRLQRAESLSVTDDLTQLYNSRYLNQVLRREAKRASRNGRPLSLLFLDLDGFKSINDSYGHLAGSNALVEAAEVIRHCARETDVVSRFGGDEFAVILPDTGSDGAAAVGDRVCERIDEHSFLHGDGLDIHLTVSVGVATFPDVAASPEELLHAADAAMYRVKSSGKNGVITAGDADARN